MLKNLIKKVLFIRKKTLDKKFLNNTARIKKWGYRDYIGGTDPETWYGIGKLQYHFLISQGLQPNHKFLDIACGSLRLGQYLIPYLSNKNYYGIDGEKILITNGLKNEILFNIDKLKQSNFSVNYNFDFSFCESYDYAIAQSLFTHLTLNDINLCFKNLAKISKKNSRFYFTFFDKHKNPYGNENSKQEKSHPNHVWVYEFKILEKIASDNGFKCNYIGAWGHPRGQKIAVASPK